MLDDKSAKEKAASDLRQQMIEREKLANQEKRGSKTKTFLKVGKSIADKLEDL